MKKWAKMRQTHYRCCRGGGEIDNDKTELDEEKKKKKGKRKRKRKEKVIGNAVMFGKIG